MGYKPITALLLTQFQTVSSTSKNTSMRPPKVNDTEF